MTSFYQHEPVLLRETVDALTLRPGSLVVDCTFGGGGHSKEILKRIAPNGKVLGIDADPDALRSFHHKAELSSRERLILVHGNFRDLERLSREHDIVPVDGVLFDLGVSSHHLDTQDRGFSFSKEAALDMRFDREQELDAHTIVNHWPEKKLAEIFRTYGDERYAGGIARKIVAERRQHPIITTTQLASLIRTVYTKRSNVRSLSIDPATRVFQALRIAVNDEFRSLELALPSALNILKPHGRLAVMTFHSGEDRIVKAFFRQEAKGCICPPSFPVCRCGKTPRLRIVSKKAIIPSEEEIKKNPRSRSVHLRVAERL